MANDSNRKAPVKYDPERGVYCARHEWTHARPVYLTVLEAYAVIEEVEISELPFLSDYIDPTALDDLFRWEREDGPNESLSTIFVFGDFEVTVRGTGEITFSPVA